MWTMTAENDRSAISESSFRMFGESHCRARGKRKHKWPMPETGTLWWCAGTKWKWFCAFWQEGKSDLLPTRLGTDLFLVNSYFWVFSNDGSWRFLFDITAILKVPCSTDTSLSLSLAVSQHKVSLTCLWSARKFVFFWHNGSCTHPKWQQLSMMTQSIRNSYDAIKVTFQSVKFQITHRIRASAWVAASLKCSAVCW